MYCQDEVKQGPDGVKKCEGPIKPKITFFGEQLPSSFLNTLSEIEGKPYIYADLLIVIGTALAVAPFNFIVDELTDSIPKVLINLGDPIKYEFNN